MPSVSTDEGRPTLVDLGVLIAGFATELPKDGGFFSHWVASTPRAVVVPILIAILARAVIVAASAVILARRVRFGGFPTAIEWAVLLLAATNIAFANLPRVSELRVEIQRGMTGPSGQPGSTGPEPVISFQIERAPIQLRLERAGLAATAALACLVVLRFARVVRLPSMVRITLILAAALLFWWGPMDLWTADLDVAFAVPPLSRPWLHRLGLELLGQFPFHLLIATPIAASLVDRLWRRRRPSWLERLAYASLFVYLMVLLATEPISEFGVPSHTLWRSLQALYDLAVLLLAIPLALCLGPIWSRWFGSGYDDRGEIPWTQEA